MNYHLFVARGSDSVGWEYLGVYGSPEVAWTTLSVGEFFVDARLEIIGDSGALETVAEYGFIGETIHKGRGWFSPYHGVERYGWQWADGRFQELAQKEDIVYGADIPDDYTITWDNGVPRLIHESLHQPKPFGITGMLNW